MAWDRGDAPLVLLDVLRAFAGGRIVRFAWRSNLWHPSGPPWAVGVPLVAWTVLLAALSVAGRAAILGYPAPILRAWVLFDIVLVWALFSAARRPRPGRLLAVAIIALFDAVVSVRHIAATEVGDGWFTIACRSVSVAGPLLGTAALFWAAWRAHKAANR